MDEHKPEFATEQAAWDWLGEQVDDPFIDNTRLGYYDDPESMAAYEAIAIGGCCGSAGYDVVIGGRAARIGCNYGH